MEAEDFHKQTTLPDLHAGEERLANIPQKIGPYKVESLLNKGGMSYLYLGLSETSEPIAIKVLVPKYIQHKEMVSRFLKEAKVIGMTNHPNIVKLYGEGEWERGLYIAMELIRGISLRQFIQSKALSQKKALEIVLQVAYALCHLHVHGVIHRDLKPENILITESGQIKVIDFGIAQLKEDLGKEFIPPQRRLMGTPAYMSPEQKENPEKVTFASDIYSLGVIAYELILGKLSHGSIHLSLLPKSLREILGKALKDDPKQRYSDIVDFITDISQYLKTMREEPAEELLSLVEEGHQILISAKPPPWPAADIGFAVQQGEDEIYVDFFRLSDTRFAFVIAESVKKLSVFHMLGFRGMLRMAIHLSKENPPQILAALNQALSKDPMHHQFAIAFLLLNAEKNSLSFISCGPNQLFHLPEGSTTLRPLATNNAALGTSENIFPLETLDNWDPGDALFLCSREVPPIKNETEIHLLTPKHQAEALLSHVPTKQSAAAISIHRTF